MNSEGFIELLDDQIDKCRAMLGAKASEYAKDDDRLHNFRKAAVLTNTTPAKALTGMMAKHSVSVYDMVASGEAYPLDMWEEKIGDHLNYLFLLKAMLADQDLIT